MSAFQDRSFGVWLTLLFLFAVWTTGCGPADGVSRGSVEGTVLVGGTPAEQGTISFIPTEGTKGPASYGVITNGKYALTAGDRGPVVGKHKVQIEAFRHLGRINHDGQPVMDQIVPETHNVQSTIVVEITKGQNKRDFDIKTK